MKYIFGMHISNSGLSLLDYWGYCDTFRNNFIQEKVITAVYFFIFNCLYLCDIFNDLFVN
jgi:hypothetical protein